MGAKALWEAVVFSYDQEALVTLTNVNDRGSEEINTTAGENAAQAAIDLFQVYAQTAYDLTNFLHVEVCKQATIAILWQRGGTSTTIAKVEYDRVFAEDGLMAKVKDTGSRGHASPASNSGVSTRSELVEGHRVRGWSDPDAIPTGILPSRRIAANE